MNRYLQRINKFIKSIFRKNDNQSRVKNPWAGLSSYEDPIKTDSPLKFCGRGDESSEVFRLIDDNIVVTLYGKSGIGKTSLLNAGVFPILRENNYAPLYIRFSADICSEKAFATQIIEELTNQIEATYGTDSIEIIDIVPENTDASSVDYLWSFFARRRFKGTDKSLIFPAIILDQFEENIISDRQQSALLLQQIAYMSNHQNMLKETVVDGQHYIYNFNFRFVVSIREDDLYRLEDIINANYLSPLKNARYRLQNLSHDNALLIIQEVGRESFASNNIEQISRCIIEASKDKTDGLIQTNVISLICSRLFDIVSRQGKKEITLQDVEEYLSNDPFEEYYTTAVRRLSERENRVIETSLVSADGRRTMLPEANIKESIKSYKDLINGDTPIFHKIQSSSGAHLIELIHDGLCPTILKNRDIRLEKKNRTILSLWLFILGLIGLWMIDTSIADNIASGFISLTTQRISGIENPLIVSLTELLSIFAFPIFIGSIVYNHKNRIYIFLCAFFILILISIFTGGYFLKELSTTFLHILSNFRERGISNLFYGISNYEIGIIAYAIILLIFCIANLNVAKGISRKEGLMRMLWDCKAVRIYIIILALFLYYKSIFSANYVCDQSDSVWGLVALPLLFFSLFDVKLSNKRILIASCSYIILIVAIALCSLFGLSLHPAFLPCVLITSFAILIAIYYNKKVLNACLKSLVNVIFLATIIILNQGFIPHFSSSDNIRKVYPWKTVVAENNGMLGIYDAVYNDTLLIPQFQSDPQSALTYYTNLPNNSFTESINDRFTHIPEANFSKSFPLSLTKSSTQWKLNVMCSPNLDHTICKLSKTISNDSNSISNIYSKSEIEAGKLFIILRNDITRFCQSGNDSILLADIPYIINYEKTIQEDLSESLQQLSINKYALTENDITTFIKALSLSLYANMLKESILRGNYTNFLDLFATYYCPVALTHLLSNNARDWTFSITTDQSPAQKFDLNNLDSNKFYAWNNIYHLLYVSESNAITPIYKLRLEKMSNNREKLHAFLLNQRKRINSYLSSLETKQADLENALAYIKGQNDKGVNINDAETKKIINSVIEASDFYHNTKTEIENDIQTIDIYSLNILFELAKADEIFEEIVTAAFNSVIDVINDNPLNAYNSMLFTYCQQLYVIGSLRGYDMAKSTELLDKTKSDISVLSNELYTLFKQANTSFKMEQQMMDSLQVYLKANQIRIE